MEKIEDTEFVRHKLKSDDSEILVPKQVHDKITNALKRLRKDPGKANVETVCRDEIKFFGNQGIYLNVPELINAYRLTKMMRYDERNIDEYLRSQGCIANEDFIVLGAAQLYLNEIFEKEQKECPELDKLYSAIEDKLKELGPECKLSKSK